MILLLVSLVISASTESELYITNGTQSTTLNVGSVVNYAYDHNMNSASSTNKSTKNWLKLDFEKYSMVGNVTIKGNTDSDDCWFSVMVFNNANMSDMTTCGRYQKSNRSIYENETVDCQNARGDGVKLAQTDCNEMMVVYEITVYGRTCNSTTGNCNCPSGYTGDRCENKDLCWNVTCQNNGTCDSTTGKCDCASRYTGDRCENLNPCLNVLCQNNGKCYSTTGKCYCASGYTGNRCQINKNLCWNVTCQNNGTCDSTTGKCDCASRYTGDRCENLNPCLNVLCQNNGTCDSTTGKCDCVSRYTGDRCEKEAKNKDLCGKMSCQNNGKCDSTTEKCNCPYSYTGDRCETKCTTPCSQGRVCYWFTPKRVACRCPGLTYGMNCRRQVNCALTERNICVTMKRVIPTIFSMRCKRQWGKTRCPTSCGYCTATLE